MCGLQILSQSYFFWAQRNPQLQPKIGCVKKILIQNKIRIGFLLHSKI